MGTVGHTWTLSPTLVLDGNFGMQQQDQTVTGPDYGTNYGLDLGIPGTNGGSERYSGLPTFANGYQRSAAHAELDAALPQGAQLHVQHRPHQGPPQARAARRASTSSATS